MSTGNINLDILLNQIREDAIARTNEAVAEIKKRYPKLSDKEAQEIHALVVAAASETDKSKASLVVTAPPSFAIRASSTKITVDSMISNAKSSILITGYSLSDYFGDMIDCLIRKSQSGVFVKFYVNHIEDQASFDKLCRYKGRFLKIYNYPKQVDKMSALHAKVISVDQEETLITSANLSCHGQEGNIELGTHIISPEIARQIEDVFTRLLFSKVFQEV